MTAGRIAIVLSGLLWIGCSDSSDSSINEPINEPRPPEPQDEDGITEIVRRHIEPLIGSPSDPEGDKFVGILVGVIHNGIRYYYHYGTVDLHSRDSVDVKDIVFFIGSNTKVFTGTLLALADSATGGRVTPATPVKSLLPTNAKPIHEPDGEILLWHLATHSAGYPDPVCPAPPVFGHYPFTSMTHFLRDFSPPYAPGEYWFYSNPGFALLGVLLSHAFTGDTISHDWGASYRNWPTLVVSEIAEQLEMPSTQVDYTSVAERVAQGYVYSDGGGSPAYNTINPPDWGLKSAGLPAGAISSTLGDMLTFLEASITPPDGALGAAMAESQRVYPGSEGLSMGFAWQLANEYLDKNGALGGYESYMAFDPDRKIGLFVFGNTSGGQTVNTLTLAGRQLLGALRGRPANTSNFPPPPTTPECPS